MEDTPELTPPTPIERILAAVGLRSRYYSKHGPWVIASQAVSSIAAFGLGVALTHLLERAFGAQDAEIQYGKYQMVVSFYGLMVIFGLPLMNHALIKSVSQGFDGSFRRVITVSFLGSTVGAIIMAGWAFKYYLEGQRDLAWAIWICALFFPIHTACDSWHPYLTGRQLLKTASIMNMIYCFMRPLGLLSLLFTTNMTLIIVCLFLPQALCRLLFCIKVDRMVPPDSDVDPGVVRYGLSLSLISSLAIVQERLYAIILGLLFTDLTFLARFGLGRGIERQVTGIWKTVCMMALPRFSQQTRAHSLKRMKRVLGIVLPINTVLSIVVILLLPYPCRWVFPVSFQAMIPYAQLWLIPAALFTPLDTLYRLYVISHSDRRLLIKIQVVDFLGEILSLVPLILIFGMVGIIYARIFAKSALACFILWDMLRSPIGKGHETGSV